MKTLEIPEKSILLHLPEHWDEMTSKQVCFTMKQAYLFTNGTIGYNDFIIRAFYNLAGIKRTFRTLVWEKLAPSGLLIQKNSNVYQLAEYYTNFMLKKLEVGFEINYNTVLNFLPVLKIGRTQFFGPTDLLADITFGEFRAAVEEMNDFFKHQEQPALNRMIACLYRPAVPNHNPDDYSGRKREPFNRIKSARIANQLTKLYDWQRLMILTWFTSCINHIKRNDIEIEGRLINLSPLFPEPDEFDGGNSSAGLGWTGILFGVSKEGVFGDIRQTDEASFFDVLLFMYDNHLQMQKFKKK